MLKNVLASVLDAEEAAQVYSAFDQVGDIVVIKIPDGLAGKKTVIAQAILANVKTAKAVFAQASAVRGDFRVRDLEFLAGENRTVTEYKEHGCRFKVDVARAYFSPRLSTERQRIASLVGEGETIVNMFAGVGTYSIIIAKANKTCRVYSIDSNPVANELCIENARLNKVSDRVIPVCADATSAIRDQLTGVADRVLMPLPERAKEFIAPAVAALKEKGVVHYFAHVRADSKKHAKELGEKDAHEAFKDYEHDVTETTVVREVGPRVYQIVADVTVTKA
ncbi:class I SAM-dependent methyltransferase family protein [Nitrososphaera sp.]|uniref:class I SAM-dependent methyltransferase n=1 Tax=Nitrososphaera sp. TaxID=1971748 RepID=UPI0031809B75